MVWLLVYVAIFCYLINSSAYKQRRRKRSLDLDAMSNICVCAFIIDLFSMYYTIYNTHILIYMWSLFIHLLREWYAYVYTNGSWMHVACMHFLLGKYNVRDSNVSDIFSTKQVSVGPAITILPVVCMRPSNCMNYAEGLHIATHTACASNIPWKYIYIIRSYRKLAAYLYIQVGYITHRVKFSSNIRQRADRFLFYRRQPGYYWVPPR